jgi:hypothetical protein
MKKLLIVLLALTVIGVLAFADDAAPAAKLSVGGWGRMFVSPITSDGTNQTVTAGPSWAGNGGRVSVSFDGSSEHFGFDWNPGLDNNSLNAVCDQAKIWAKVSPMLTIQVGKIEGDVLRGKLGDTGDVCATAGNDDIFARFNPSTGMLLDITPVDGLYLGAAIDSTVTTAGALGGKTNVGYVAAVTSSKASDVYKAIQVGAGYTIKDVGMIRAQYIGSAIDKGAAIQAAFAYTGMAGLTIDVGAKIPMNSDAQMKAALGVSYAKDALAAYLIGSAQFAGASAAKLNAQGTATVYYTVADPLAAGLEVAFSGMADGVSLKYSDIVAPVVAPDGKLLQIMPAIKLGYSNGYVKIGFDAMLGLESGAKFAYQVPVQLEYWF